jgi:hypothetical protein
VGRIRKLCGVSVNADSAPLSVYLNVKGGPRIAGPYQSIDELDDSDIARDVSSFKGLRDVLEERGLIDPGAVLVSVPVLLKLGEDGTQSYPDCQLDGVVLKRDQESQLQRRLEESYAQRDKMAHEAMEAFRSINNTGIKALQDVGRQMAETIGRSLEHSVKPVLDNLSLTTELSRKEAQRIQEGATIDKLIDKVLPKLLDLYGASQGDKLIKAITDGTQPQSPDSNKAPEPNPLAGLLQEVIKMVGPESVPAEGQPAETKKG